MVHLILNVLTKRKIKPVYFTKRKHMHENFGYGKGLLFTFSSGNGL
jgi:hypothetical protein